MAEEEFDVCQVASAKREAGNVESADVRNAMGTSVQCLATFVNRLALHPELSMTGDQMVQFETLLRKAESAYGDDFANNEQQDPEEMLHRAFSIWPSLRRHFERIEEQQMTCSNCGHTKEVEVFQAPRNAPGGARSSLATRPHSFMVGNESANHSL